MTTSFAVFLFDPNVWLNAGLDLTQLHFYSTFDTAASPRSSGRTSRRTCRSSPRRASRSRRSPSLFGELGVDSRGPAETNAADPGGIGVHDGLFAGSRLGRLSAPR